MYAGTPLTKDHPDEKVSLFQGRGRNVLNHLVVLIYIYIFLNLGYISGERYAGGGIYIYTLTIGRCLKAEAKTLGHLVVIICLLLLFCFT